MRGSKWDLRLPSPSPESNPAGGSAILSIPRAPRKENATQSLLKLFQLLSQSFINMESVVHKWSQSFMDGSVRLTPLPESTYRPSTFNRSPISKVLSTEYLHSPISIS